MFGAHGWRKLVQRFNKMRRRARPRRSLLRVEQLEARLALAAVDLEVDKVGPATATAGTNITYSLTVMNNLPGDATDVSVTDTVPTGTSFVDVSVIGGTGTAVVSGNDVTVTFPTLLDGETGVIQLVVLADPSDADGTTITNTAMVAPGGADTDDISSNDSSTVNTTVDTSADVSVTKTGPATVVAGMDATYTITTTNNGPSDAQNVSTTDIPPPNTTLVSFTQDSGPPDMGTLAPLDTQTFTLVLHINADAPDGATLTNEADATSTGVTATPDNDITNNTSTVDSTVQTSADLAVTKTGPATAAAGDQVTYTLSLTNSGPSDAQAVVLSDTLPTGETFVSASEGTGSGTSFTDTIGTFANGASRSITIIAAISASQPVGTITNTATVNSTTADSTAGNNTATLDTAVTAPQAADLAIAKTGPATVLAGNQITYTLSLTNNGPNDAQGVNITDTLPTGETFVSASEGTGSGTGFTDAIGTVANGASRTITVVAQVGAGVTNGTTLTNSVTVSSTTSDSTPGNNTATFDTTVTTPQADLAMTKTGPATVLAGNQVTYTLSLTNNGPNDAQGVSVTDTLPAGETFVSASEGTGSGTSFTDAIGTVANGANRTITLVAQVGAGVAGGTTLTNSVTVTSTTSDLTPGNNTATIATTVTAATADVAVTKTGPATVTPGTQITYTLTVTNAGPASAASVNLTDTLPAGETFVSASEGTGSGTSFTDPIGTLASGTTRTITLVAQVSPTAAGGTTLTNNAAVTTTTTESSTTNNTATFGTTVNTPQADVAVTKTGPATATAGTQITYTLTVTNNGPSNAQGVTVTDTLPTGETFVSASEGTGAGLTFTDTIGALATGASHTITLIATISGSASGTLTNTAAVSTTSSDLVTGNNTATFGTTVTPATLNADLRITKTDGVTTIAPGATNTYTIVVTNLGPGGVTGVTVSDAFPLDFQNATFTSVASGGVIGNTVIGSGDIADTVNMTSGSSITYTVMGTVSLTASGTLVNTATVAAPAGVDLNPDNDTATDTDFIRSPSEGLPTCDIFTLNDPGSPGTAVIEDDADNPGSNVLLITGTRFNDVITVVPQPRHAGMMQVVQNRHVLVAFASSDVQRIVVYGLQGSDQIVISAALFQPAVIFGGNGNDVIVGGGGDDQIDGENGNDTIVGGGGDDILCGDNGRDVVVGGLGNDTLFGEAGNDVLAGGGGDDLLLGGDGSDVLDGGVGSDRLYGQSGNDTLVGGVGNNILVGGSGNDQLIARTGRNIVIGGTGIDTLYGNAGDDILIAGSTANDDNDEALQAILAEWTSSNSYSARIDNIRNGGGANGAFVFDDTTVFDDGARDTLFGAGGMDWFWAGANDRLRDRARNEQVN